MRLVQKELSQGWQCIYFSFLSFLTFIITSAVNVSDNISKIFNIVVRFERLFVFDPNLESDHWDELVLYLYLTLYI